jgi:hypothetical protein
MVLMRSIPAEWEWTHLRLWVAPRRNAAPTSGVQMRLEKRTRVASPTAASSSSADQTMVHSISGKSRLNSRMRSSRRLV